MLASTYHNHHYDALLATDNALDRSATLVANTLLQ